MTQPRAHLFHAAKTLAGPAGELFLAAQHISHSLQAGGHGRRKAGSGEEFWQYRPARMGDSKRSIDWRQSARSDQTYVRETEWQGAQTLRIWADTGASMRMGHKAEHARLLTLSCAINAAARAERVGMLSGPASTSATHLHTMASSLLTEEARDHGAPHLQSGARETVLLASDFFAPLEATRAALQKAKAAGTYGVLLHVLDPVEVAFPFAGHTRFVSPSGSDSHLSPRADALRDAYLEALETRIEQLTQMAQTAGWHYVKHITDMPLAATLIRLQNALSGHRSC